MKNFIMSLLTLVLSFTVSNLYAKSYKVLLCLNYGEYNQKYDTISVENGKPINIANWATPTRVGYKFKGYYNSRDAENQYWHPIQYIDNDGRGVRNVSTNRDYEQIFYAHWTPKKYVLTFYTSVGELKEEIGIRPESPNHNIVSQGENLKISVDVEYDSKIADRLWSQDIITIRPGYKFLSLYDAEGNGEEIYRVTDNGNSLSAVKGEYWDGWGTNGKWIKDLGEDGDTLIIYPRYDPKFEIVEDGDRINFFNNDIQVTDIKAAIEEDNSLWGAAPLVLDITQYTGTIHVGSNMYDDLGIRFYDGVLAFNYLIGHTRSNGQIEPNCLVYLSEKNNMLVTQDNVVKMKDKKCANFVLTDRYRVKIPYSFTAENAIYERDKGYNNSDGEVNQAKNSQWGTICLPFSINNGSQTDITLYTPHAVNHTTKTIQFKEKNSNYTLSASCPCVYKRKGVKEGSKITVKARNVIIPVNTNYSTTKSYIEPNWEFVGTYKPLVFIGPNHSNKPRHQDWNKYTEEIFLPKNREHEIFYYKQDTFTQLTNNKRMYLHPYRAYFIDKSGNNNAKLSEYKIEIIEEEITGIKEIKRADKAKIYSLNGIRVNIMKKGQMYIVNGKKIVY